MEYKKHTHREHIYELPDTYIGSIETSKEEHYVLKEQNASIKYQRMEGLTLDKQLTILIGLLMTFLVSSLFFYFRLDSLENQLLFHSSKLTHSFVTIN